MKPHIRKTIFAAAVTLVVIAVAVWTLRFRFSPGSQAPGFPRALDPALFDSQNAFQQTSDLVNLGPRESGSIGAERAAAHIASRLRGIGLNPVTEVFTNATPNGLIIFRNVLAPLPGSDDRIVVIASHYDTKAGIARMFCGANDSGSSTGLLLELARILRKSEPLPCNFLLVFLDGEECFNAYSETDGLHGSRHLARRMRMDGRARDVQAVIVLDMIGDRTLSITVPRNSSPVLVSLVFDAAREENVRERFSLSTTSILDDHVPFLRAGMPAIDIIDFQYGSLPGQNDYWHTVQDTMDKISADSLETVGRVVLRTINKLLLAASPPTL